MKITAVTKFKHGILLDSIRATGFSVCAFARHIGVNASSLCHYVNLAKKPSFIIAEKIISGLATLGVVTSFEELWPEAFTPTGKLITIEQSQDVEPLLLSQYVQYESDRLLSNSNGETPPEIPESVQFALKSLRPTARKIVNLYCEGMKVEEISKEVKIHRNRVGQIFDHSIREIQCNLSTQEALKGTPVEGKIKETMTAISSATPEVVRVRK